MVPQLEGSWTDTVCLSAYVESQAQRPQPIKVEKYSFYSLYLPAST